MAETWYVLSDGSFADPAKCSHDADGVLRGPDGQEVAMRGDAYSSRSVDPDEERAKGRKMRFEAILSPNEVRAAIGAPEIQEPKAVEIETKESTPEDKPKRKYTTRQMKAD